jgi:hypothetical protein
MKNLLNEIKAMNKIAGTQMTKEQEIKLIRERLEQLNEASAYYTYLVGSEAIQGDPMNSVKDITKDGMDPDDIENVGDCYVSKVGNYTVYVITSAKSKRDKWVIITPYDRKLNNNEFSYDISMKAIKSPGKKISFEDLLKK